jgi:hypothetical protein
MAGVARPALAQTTPGGEPKVSISGYVQPQLDILQSGGRTRDQARLRRAVVTLDVEITSNWQAEFQTDLGPLTYDSDRITVKNALLRYAGWEASRGIVVSVGNQKMPFSRSVFGSSSRRSLVERPFTGDRAYGSPGRAISIRADGWHRDRTLFWSAAVADTRHSANAFELRIDGVAEIGDTGNEGHLLGARVELHPRGEVARQQGDFARGPFHFTVGAAAYGWWSDGDSVLRESEVDVRHAGGLEISGALRGAGLFIDVEFEHVSATARRPFSSGLYAQGDPDLRKGSIETGYMLVRERFEIVGAIDVLDARTFDATWRRAAAGANYYVKRHDLKFALMHRESFNIGGVRDARSHATYVQAHVGF